MEYEEEYIETDIRKIIIQNLKQLGLDAHFVEKSEVERPPYYSGFFAGSIFRMVDSMGTVAIKGQNFDYIHVVRRG
ncbi:MAG: hypothetical protein QXU32_04260 [Nitrososphaerales archaeon]